MIHGLEPPAQRGRSVDWPAPKAKANPGVRARKNVWPVKTDEELREVFKGAGDLPVFVDFGASWCDHCRQMLPAFVRFADKIPKDAAVLAIADVDKVPEISRDIRFTPTFAFYRKGKKVDEIYGTKKQQLWDHMWLHLDSEGKGSRRKKPPPVEEEVKQ